MGNKADINPSLQMIEVGYSVLERSYITGELQEGDKQLVVEIYLAMVGARNLEKKCFGET